VVRWPFAENDRARTERATEGLVKLVVEPQGPGAGGVHRRRPCGRADPALGRWRSQQQAKDVERWPSLIAPYPTRGEAGKRAAGAYFAPRLFSPRTRKLVQFPAMVRMTKTTENRRSAEPLATAQKPLWQPPACRSGVLLGRRSASPSAFDLQRFLAFDTLREHDHQALRGIRRRAWPLAHRARLRPGLCYAGSVAVSLPGAVFLTIAGGFLFGIWLGSLPRRYRRHRSAPLPSSSIAKTSLGEGLREQRRPLAAADAGRASTRTRSTTSWCCG
jgi:hypothetical protein